MLPITSNSYIYGVSFHLTNHFPVQLILAVEESNLCLSMWLLGNASNIQTPASKAGDFTSLSTQQYLFGAINRIRTCTLSHGILSPTCLPVPS